MYPSLYFSASLLPGSETWWLDLLHSLNPILVEQRDDLRAPVLLRHLLFSATLSPSPILLLYFSHLHPLSASSSPSVLCRRSYSSQMPIFTEISCLFSSFPFHHRPPPFSFACCVRVCRWLMLAGSVTRGNWGRVHFKRTNGNKLICFHCCFCDAVSCKRTKGWV